MPKLTDSGFTIIELITATAVLGLIIPGLVTLITTLDRFNDRARDLSIINSLAENKVESLRSISYVGLENGTVDFSNELPQTIAAPRTATYTVSNVSNGLKSVDISITYNDHGNDRTLNYKTFVGELGVGQY